MQPETPYQPPVTTPTEPAYQQPPQAPIEQHNPGKTLAIVGFIFAFIGLQIIGLILSIVGLVKSKKAGMKNGLAIAGIILNIVFMIITVFLVMITVVAYAGITNRANNTAAQTEASRAVADIYEYSADNNGRYPTTRTELTQYSTVNFEKTPLLGAPTDPATVALYQCGDDGNAVEYWDYVNNEPKYLFTDDGLSIADCSLLES